MKGCSFPSPRLYGGVERAGKHWMNKGVAGVMESSTHWIMHASNSKSRDEMIIDVPVLSQEGC